LLGCTLLEVLLALNAALAVPLDLFRRGPCLRPLRLCLRLLWPGLGPLFTTAYGWRSAAVGLARWLCRSRPCGRLDAVPSPVIIALGPVAVLAVHVAGRIREMVLSGCAVWPFRRGPSCQGGRTIYGGGAHAGARVRIHIPRAP
jgi:hypothetical protein